MASERVIQVDVLDDVAEEVIQANLESASVKKGAKVNYETRGEPETPKVESESVNVTPVGPIVKPKKLKVRSDKHQLPEPKVDPKNIDVRTGKLKVPKFKPESSLKSEGPKFKPIEPKSKSENAEPKSEKFTPDTPEAEPKKNTDDLDISKVKPESAKEITEGPRLKTKKNKVKPKNAKVILESTQVERKKPQVKPESSEVDPESENVSIPEKTKVEPEGAEEIPKSPKVKTKKLKIMPKSSEVDSRSTQALPGTAKKPGKPKSKTLKVKSEKEVSKPENDSKAPSIAIPIYDDSDYVPPEFNIHDERQRCLQHTTLAILLLIAMVFTVFSLVVSGVLESVIPPSPVFTDTYMLPGYTHEFFDLHKPFKESTEVCNQRGGELLYFNTTEEHGKFNEFVESKFKPHIDEISTNKYAKRGLQIWTGIRISFKAQKTAQLYWPGMTSASEGVMQFYRDSSVNRMCIINKAAEISQINKAKSSARGENHYIVKDFAGLLKNIIDEPGCWKMRILDESDRLFLPFVCKVRSPGFQDMLPTVPQNIETKNSSTNGN